MEPMSALDRPVLLLQRVKSAGQHLPVVIRDTDVVDERVPHREVMTVMTGDLPWPIRVILHSGGSIPLPARKVSWS